MKMIILISLILASQAVTSMAPLDLNGTLLTVAANRVFLNCDFTDELTSEGETIFRPSFELKYLNILKHKFNFRAKLLDMKRNFGREINGTWDGTIEAVYNQKSNFGLCALSTTYDRSRVVKFSHFIKVDYTHLLSFKPGPKKQSLIISIPFSTTVWISIGISLIVLCLVQYCNCLLLRETKSFLDIFLWHYAISTRQSILLKRDDPYASKLLYFLWVVTILILTTGYLSVLHSVLTVTEYEKPIETVEELLQALTNDKVIPCIMNRTYLQNGIITAEKSGSEVYLSIKKNMQRNKVDFVPSFKIFLQHILRWPRLRPAVFFASEYLQQLIQEAVEKHQKLHVSKENIFYSFSAMALPYKSPLIPYFNDVILRLWEGGIPEHWMRSTEALFASRFKKDRVGIFESFFGVRMPELAYSNHTAQPQKGDVRELFFGDLKSIFVIWLIGLSLSSVVFGIELCSLIRLPLRQ